MSGLDRRFNNGDARVLFGTTALAIIKPRPRAGDEGRSCRETLVNRVVPGATDDDLRAAGFRPQYRSLSASGAVLWTAAGLCVR